MSGRIFKYMGTSDNRVIPAGDKFGGRVVDGLAKDLVFDSSNHWMVDVEAEGLSQAQVEALATEPGFQEVDREQVVPDNEHQRAFRPHSGMENLSGSMKVDDIAPSAPATVHPDGSTSVVFDDDDDPGDPDDQADPPVVEPETKGKKAKP